MIGMLMSSRIRSTSGCCESRSSAPLPLKACSSTPLLLRCCRKTTSYIRWRSSESSTIRIFCNFIASSFDQAGHAGAVGAVGVDGKAFLRGKRNAQEIPLAEGHAGLVHHGPLVLSLDPFGDDFGAAAAGEGDDAAEHVPPPRRRRGPAQDRKSVV